MGGTPRFGKSSSNFWGEILKFGDLGGETFGILGEKSTRMLGPNPSDFEGESDDFRDETPAIWGINPSILGPNSRNQGRKLTIFGVKPQ